MTPNQILSQTRKANDLTMLEMAEALRMTTQRMSQYEKGDAIPVERIREWLAIRDLPEWARTMCLQMWAATLEQQHETLGEQISALGEQISAMV